MSEANGIGIAIIFGDTQGGGTGILPGFLQQEDLFYILQENGDKIIIS